MKFENVKEYWDTVRKIEESLDGEYVYLQPIDRFRTENGELVQVDKENAARRIAEGSHRTAKKDEIDAFLKREDDKREAAAKAEFKKLHPIHITVARDAAEASAPVDPPQEKGKK